MVKISKTKHVTKTGVVKNNPSKKSKEDRMIAEVKSFMEKLSKDVGEEPMLSIYKENGKIYFSTDGFLCTNVADPSRSELPYLMREAWEEFGKKGPMPKVDAWRYRNEVDRILKKYGYSSDNYDSCTFYAYK